MSQLTTTADRVPTKSSTGEYWVTWYDALESFFGKKDAKQIFVQAWEKRGIGTKANTSYLREQMSSRGINVQADGLFGELGDSAGNVWDSVTGTFSSILGIGKTAGYVAIGLAGVVVIGVIYSYTKRGISFDPMTRTIKA